MQSLVDLAQNSTSINLVIIGIFIMIVLMMLKWLGVTEVGPLKLEYRSQANMHQMNNLNDVIDHRLRDTLQESIDIMCSQILNDTDQQDIVAMSIMSAVKLPLYMHTSRNHLTSKLAPHNIERYKHKIWSQIQVNWTRAYNILIKQKYELKDKEYYDEYIKKYFNLWIDNVKHEVCKSCEEKITNYKRFKENIASKYWIKVIDECIDKNEVYIKILGGDK